MALAIGTNSGICESAPSSDPAASNDTQDARCGAQKFTTDSAGTITEIGWYCDNATEEANWEGGIYTHDSVNDRPGDLLTGVSRTNAKGTGSGWKVATGLSIAISGAGTYWLAIQLDDTATTTNSNRGTGTGYTFHYLTGGRTTLPDSWGASAGTLSNTITAFYALFTASAGGDPEGSLVGGKLLRGGLLRHGVLVRAA